MSPRKTAKPPAPSRHPMQMRSRGNRPTQPPPSTAPVNPSVPSDGPPTPPQPPSSPDIPSLHPPPNASAAPVMHQPYGLYDRLPGPPESDFAAPRRLEVFAQSLLNDERRIAELDNIFGQRKQLDDAGRAEARGELPKPEEMTQQRDPSRASSLPQLGVAGSSWHTNMLSIYEEDENMSDAISSFQVPQTQREENLSFAHLSQPDLRRSSIDSELEVANMLYPPPMEIDSVAQRQRAPQVSQTQQQAQPIPPNYPQNAALRRGPTLLNL
ncbi:hypothetical protein BDZ89DRAFT_1129089 [Hymenopellis radicata]|nr:hypothetical protein BDZ89DRAFT_1129089 [Hymenopellis radicata]